MIRDLWLPPGVVWRRARRPTAVASAENRLAHIERRLTLLTWMVGANIVLTLAILGKLLR